MPETKMNLRVLKLWHLISINTSQCESRSDMQSSCSRSLSLSRSLSFCFCHLCREVKVEVKVLPLLQAAIVAECCCDCCKCCRVASSSRCKIDGCNVAGVVCCLERHSFSYEMDFVIYLSLFRTRMKSDWNVSRVCGSALAVSCGWAAKAGCILSAYGGGRERVVERETRMPNLAAKAGNINLANYIDTFARPLARGHEAVEALTIRQSHRINWRPPLFYTHSQNNVRQAVSCQGPNGDREIGISTLDNQISALNRRSWRLTYSRHRLGLWLWLWFCLGLELKLQLRLHFHVSLRPPVNASGSGNGHQFARLPMMLAMIAAAAATPPAARPAVPKVPRCHRCNL